MSPPPLDVLDVFAVLGWIVLPTTGLLRTHRRLRRAGSRAVGRAALGAAVSGVVVIGVAVVPGLAEGAERTFAGHMAQHLLLGSVGPLLLVVGRAAELVPWALPVEHRRRLRRRARLLLRPPRSLPAATATMVGVWWAWHVPALYDAAVAVPVLHPLEHASYLVAGCWFWAAVAPHRHRTGASVLALFAVTLAVGLVGAVLALSPVAFYEEVAATSRDARLDDQHVGGLLMWTLGGLVHLVAMVVQLVRWLGAHGLPDGTTVAPERGVAT